MVHIELYHKQKSPIFVDITIFKANFNWRSKLYQTQRVLAACRGLCPLDPLFCCKKKGTKKEQKISCSFKKDFIFLFKLKVKV